VCDWRATGTYSRDIGNWGYFSFLLEKHVFLHQFTASPQQTYQMETVEDNDVGCLQVSADLKEDAESEARHDAIVRLEIAQDADQVLGQTMEEIQYENHVSHLYQSQTQIKR